MWQNIGRFILKYRLPILITLAALTAFMGYHASKVQLSYDFSRAIPLNNPNIKFIKSLEKHLAKMATC
jgi:predicted RND superfamily exporter protein